MNVISAQIPAPPATVERIETAILDVPFKRTQRFARFEATAQTTVLVRLTASNGMQGIGEATVPCGPWWSGDAVETMKLMIDQYFAPEFVGLDLRNVEHALAGIARVARGNSFAKAGVEMALLDLLGRHVGLPVWALLGGKFRDECAVAWPLASGDLDTDLQEIDTMLSTGRASAFKVKMGSETLRRDLDRVQAYVTHLNGRAGVRVDPNEAWSFTDAKLALPRLQEMGIDMIEQPFDRVQLDWMSRMSARSGVPIMIDEGAQSEADVLRAVQSGAAHLLSLKIMKAGGLRASRRMADLAETGGMSLYMGTFLETSLGTAAGLHLAATCKALPLGGEVIGPMLMADDIAANPVAYTGGAAHLPDGPGLGIDLDEDRVAAMTRKT
ncbi:muconate/chloromuconate family cycloisomerase [Litoreibacter roseus]|uniref:Chloromuconate cycloisomerase n=1 Tax=Litoreibacter roseus TaxID=2601869 RepID=A0A6N6JL93_9RHOB|nr:muconate/chloromuconate family cycloisomerase [Litoreibacter roseus]GFE66179.1 chloromuconate cycloisomerase [Litoreibacter roseus]